MANLAVMVPSALSASVVSAARGNSGLVAAAGSAVDPQGRHSYFIAVFPPDGGVEKLIPTKSYYPALISVAQDGSIWTEGLASGRNADPNVFWHFDQNGVKIGSVVSQRTFSGALTLTDPGNHLTASIDRTAFICPKDSRYIEISLGGGIITDISTLAFLKNNEWAGALSLTDDGRVFVDTQSGPPAVIRLYTLDTKTGQMTANALPQVVRLVGSIGSALVGFAGNTLYTLAVAP